MNQDKVNKIAKSFALTLINAGTKMLKSAFHLKPEKIMGTVIIEPLIKRYFPGAKITFSDGYYYTIPWSQWLEIIDVDWTDKMKYLKEKRDCDNFAYSFTSRMSEIFEVNSAGVAFGWLYDKNNPNKLIGGHFWNCIISKKNIFDSYSIFFYEPMNDRWIKYKGGKLIFGLNHEYRPVSFRFF